MSEKKVALSIVIPAFNESQSLPALVKRLILTLEKNMLRGEIIIIDDGSTDETLKIANQYSGVNNNIKIYHHKRRMGKTASLLTGFENATGDIVVILDADLQYAPEDVVKLLKKIEDGYDVVNGWRKNRKDSIGRKIPSALYNLISKLFFGLKIHDINSGLKAFKKDVIKELDFREGQHRFFLNLAHYRGFKVGQVEIQHFPRGQGKTKYGSSRMFWGFFDLIALRLQLAFIERPMALFGLSGIILFFMGFLASVYVLVLKIFFGEPFQTHFAMLLLASLLMIAGVQTFLFGFVAEMISNLRSRQLKVHKDN